MKASDIFVKSLEAEGVKYVFGVPGEENLDLLESLRTSKIQFITTRHEQAAVFMAATYGRLTGHAGVALSTLGPGATNLITGVAFAQLGGMPLITISGQKPIKKSKQGRFQIIDIVTMMAPITKMAATIVSADRIPSIIRQAFKSAESERPGAVHLELPEDIASDLTNALVIKPEKVRRPGPDSKAITQALDLIEKAKRPLVLIASGANRKMVRKQLLIFLEKTKIPFVTTQMGKGVITETHPQYLGTAAISSGDYVHCALDYADTIIVIGHDIIEKPPVILTPTEHTVIDINFSEAQVDDVYLPTLEVVGDISHTLWALGEQIKTNAWDFSHFERIKAGLKNHLVENQESDSFPLKPQRIVADLRTALPPTGILALDNGMYKLWIARNFPALEQNTVLLDNSLATMGAGLPIAIAAKLINPQLPIVAVVGDGGFLMSSQELETAQRLCLQLTVLILRDDGFGMIKWKQDNLGFSSFGLNFSNPNFVKLAQSYGLTGIGIKSADELLPALLNSFTEPGITIIDCPIDYSENHRVFDQELKQKTCNI